VILKTFCVRGSFFDSSLLVLCPLSLFAESCLSLNFSRGPGKQTGKAEGTQKGKEDGSITVL